MGVHPVQPLALLTRTRYGHILGYGHNHNKVDVFAGCGICARSGGVGATLECVEIRSVAARHSDRRNGKRAGQGYGTRRSRPAAVLPARTQGRCRSVGAGTEGRAPRGHAAAGLQGPMIHLDTSFLISALTPGSPEDRRLRGWIRDGETMAMSAVAWAEFLCGSLAQSDIELAAEIVGTRPEFTPDHAVIAARLFNESGRRRGSLIDCMIAASAIADGVPIATANVADFRRFEDSGLTIAGP